MNAPTFEIVRLQATDRVELTAFVTPGRWRAAAIYLHGLGGNAYRSRLVPALAAALTRAGIGLCALNTRGADLVTTRTQGRRRAATNGAVYEIFSECVRDITGAIALLRARGARTIHLIGHSTGANKIAYALQRGVPAARVVYLAPGDDVGIQRKLLGPRKFAAMQQLAARWRAATPHRLMPVKNLGYLDISAASYHSLFGTQNRMDQFPWMHLQPDARWRRLARSAVPAALIMGAADEYLPVPPHAVAEFLAAHMPCLTVRLLAGADHGFAGYEAAMAAHVAKFLRGR